MNTKLTGFVAAYQMFSVQIFLVILGCIAIWWGYFVFSDSRNVSSIEQIASRIIAGDPFKSEILARQIPIVNATENSAYCRPVALRDAAIIKLRIAEEANLGGNQNKNEERLNGLISAIHKSLSCSPADPYLWVVLFWLERTRNGVTSENLKYLRISYRLGPNEGWVALKRNPVAIGVLRALPADLSNYALIEFADLVNDGFYNEAFNILVGPGWEVKDRLLARLNTVTKDRRQALARLLYDRGYDVPIPGITRSGDRLRGLRP